MQLFFALIPFVALASAYQVTSPNQAAGWTTVDPNVVTWQRVSSNPLNFTLVLTNHAQTSSYQQVLAAFVDGTVGKLTVTPPSTGYPTGNNFRVTFVRDTEHLSTIYAQSGRFSIDTPTSINIDKHDLMIQMKQIRQEGGGDGGGGGEGAGEGDGEGDGDGNGNGNNPSPPPGSTGSNNGDRIIATGSAGLIFGALAAIVL